MKSYVAKLFSSGSDQAVLLPQEFRFRGTHVRIRRLGTGILLEPVILDVRQWFKEMDQFNAEPFMKTGRNLIYPADKAASHWSLF